MGNGAGQPGQKSHDLVSCDTLERHLGDSRWRILDTRFDLFDTDAGEKAYRKSHIPGALYAHLDRDLAGPPGGDRGRHPLPDRESWQATAGRWGIGPRTRVVVYDDADLELGVDLILGPFVVRLFFTAGPVDPDLVQPIVDAVIQGLGGTVEQEP